MNIERILKCVRKTNPDMTKKKLLKELYMSYYSTVALIIKLNFEKESG